MSQLPSVAAELLETDSLYLQHVVEFIHLLIAYRVVLRKFMLLKEFALTQQAVNLILQGNDLLEFLCALQIHGIAIDIKFIEAQVFKLILKHLLPVIETLGHLQQLEFPLPLRNVLD